MSIDHSPHSGANMAPAHALAVLRAFVAMAAADRLGREIAPQSRMLALDALEALDDGGR